ncbi:MAG TPA: transcription antitermination factor NusB [Gemmatimonadales bacterium]|nr:transcription antitermination factor NusB [Gemmatimonadales bacterium]
MPAPGLAPRASAWRILHLARRGVPFDLALRRGLSGLAEPDRRLAHELAAGALRQRAALDAAIAPHVAGGLDRVRDDLLDILRVGAYQLLFLERVPRHAAVDTAVMLGRRLSGARVGGFVNAVLRKVAEQPRDSGCGQRDTGIEIRTGAPQPTGVPASHVAGPSAETLALAFSHPDWLVARWLERFGPEATERLLAANNSRPGLVLQPARWSAEALAAALDRQAIRWRPAPYGAGLIVEGRRPDQLPGFAAGAFFVQDPAQALAVRFFDAPEGARVLDACAAPGGKALALASRAGFVAAADLRPTRARRMRENLLRAGGVRAAVLVADALAPPVRPMDAVLFDAPCLGTGSFARHPDARWRVTPAALAALAAQAGRLLAALANVVRPGGLLFFATCSIEPEENEVQIEAFLGGDRRFRREPSAAAPVELLSPAGDLILLPQRHGTDGAYAARLRRIS